jgi:hypothetical protein
MAKKIHKKITNKNAKKRGGVMPEEQFHEVIRRIVRVKPRSQTK